MAYRYLLAGYEYDEDGYVYPSAPGQEVIIEDDHPVKSGLLDQYGMPIYRVRNRIKMGFQIS